MSKLEHVTVECPVCGLSQQTNRFQSLNAQLLPHVADEVLAGTFAQLTCDGCGETWRPEQKMLFADVPHRLWVVMHPRADRSHRKALEEETMAYFAQEFGAAPSPVMKALSECQILLVFGHERLTEAVRLSRAGIPQPLVECLKLTVMRDRLADFYVLGPVELVYEQAEEGQITFGVHRLEDGSRVKAVEVPFERLHEIASQQEHFMQHYPDLFGKPSCDCCRYLYA
ncbi:MAG: CpXC domain-containing protein [Bradymonadia bacterium]